MWARSAIRIFAYHVWVWLTSTSSTNPGQGIDWSHQLNKLNFGDQICCGINSVLVEVIWTVKLVHVKVFRWFRTLTQLPDSFSHTQYTHGYTQTPKIYFVLPLTVGLPDSCCLLLTYNLLFFHHSQIFPAICCVWIGKWKREGQY